MTTPLGPDLRLEGARAAYDAHDYGAVVEALGELDAELLLGTPELGYLLAASLRQTGRAADAIRLARRLEEPVERRGDERLGLRLLNLTGMLSYDAGEGAAAEGAWLTLLERATAADEPEWIANACNNLGVVYTVAARSDEALTAYGRALASFERLDDRAGLAQANQNLAIVCREKRMDDDADEHFLTAREHATATRDTRLLGRIEVERSILLLRRGDGAVAKRLAERAARVLTEASDRAGIGEAERALGLIALADGRTAEGVARLDAALDHAREAGNALLEAEAALALAVARAPRRPATESDPAVARALARFDAMGAGGWGRGTLEWTADLIR